MMREKTKQGIYHLILKTNILVAGNQKFCLFKTVQVAELQDFIDMKMLV
jgi:hypothetical protein